MRPLEMEIRVFDENVDSILLALLDVVMPELGSKAVFNYIQERCPGMDVLFVSGYSTEGIHDSFVLTEGMQLIQKPYKRNDLLRKVREVLDGVQDNVNEPPRVGDIDTKLAVHTSSC